MAFCLPAAIFVVFAEIFSATGQGEPDMNVGVLRLASEPALERVVESVALASRRDYASKRDLLIALTAGDIDVGLVIEGGQNSDDPVVMRVLSDPSRPLAGAVLQRQLSINVVSVAPAIYFDRERRWWASIVGDLTPEQARRLDAVLEGERPVTFPPALVQQEMGQSPTGFDPAVSYYAGAVGIMFILFASMNSAAGLIRERNSGLFDRYLSFGRGVGFAIRGRALFITMQGTLQMLVIFTVARWFYDVPWEADFLAWSAITIASSACVAGVAVLCAALCNTPAQMQTFSTFFVLVMSALGGSMVPTYLMPVWIRWIGGFTPNAWSIGLYDSVITRGLDLTDLVTPLVLLGLTAFLSFAAAVVLTQRKLVL